MAAGRRHRGGGHRNIKIKHQLSGATVSCVKISRRLAWRAKKNGEMAKIKRSGIEKTVATYR